MSESISLIFTMCSKLNESDCLDEFLLSLIFISSWPTLSKSNRTKWVYVDIFGSLNMQGFCIESAGVIKTNSEV